LQEQIDNIHPAEKREVLKQEENLLQLQDSNLISNKIENSSQEIKKEQLVTTKFSKDIEYRGKLVLGNNKGVNLEDDMGVDVYDPSEELDADIEAEENIP